MKVQFDNFIKYTIIFIFFFDSSYAVNVDLNIKAKEYDDSSDNGLSTITIIKDELKIKEESSDSIISSASEIHDSQESIEIKFSSPVYIKRTIRLRQMPEEDVAVKRYFDLFLVKPDIDTTYETIDNVARKISQGGVEEANKQSSILEYAYDKLKCEDSQYGVKVKYNFARTLLELCKNGFDTCEKSSILWKELKNKYFENEIFFNREKIRRLDSDRAINIINDTLHNEDVRKIIVKWPSIESKFQNGNENYKNVGEELGLMCDNYEKNMDSSIILKSNGKPRFSICRDAGVSFLLYTDYLVGQNDFEDKLLENKMRYNLLSINYLQKAINHGDKNKRTETNLKLAKDRNKRLLKYIKEKEEDEKLNQIAIEFDNKLKEYFFEKGYDDNDCEFLTKNISIDNRNIIIQIESSDECGEIKSINDPVVVRIYDEKTEDQILNDAIYKTLLTCLQSLDDRVKLIKN